jgi:predicted RNase H-like HicB family nuclease
MTRKARAKSYQVDVVRSGNWWSITVPALTGVFSQAKRLDQVEAMAREAIAMMLDVDEASVGDINVVVTPPANVVDLLERLKVSVETATEATQAAAEARHQAAKLLRDEGLPMRDVGELIGVSHQRVSQILAS